MYTDVRQLRWIKVIVWEPLWKYLWMTGVYESGIQAIRHYGPEKLTFTPGRRLKVIQRSRQDTSPEQRKASFTPGVRFSLTSQSTPTPTGATNYWQMESSACKEWVQNVPVMTHQTTGNQEMFLLVLSLYWLGLPHSSNQELLAPIPSQTLELLAVFKCLRCEKENKQMALKDKLNNHNTWTA